MIDNTTRAFEIMGASEERAAILTYIQGRLRVLRGSGISPYTVEELMGVVRLIQSRSAKDKAETEAM